MTGCKFKLEQEQFVPEVTVNQYQTSSKKINQKHIKKNRNRLINNTSKEEINRLISHD